MKNGIDVSDVNGVINWEKVKPQIDFAIIRAGYGNNQADRAFETNASACEELGIPFGLYWFSYAYTPEMAKEEAVFCIKQARKYGIEYPIAYVFEYDSMRYAKEHQITVTKELIMNLVTSFCEEIKRVGYQAAVYINANLKDYFNQEMVESQDYKIWYADTTGAAVPPDISIWQYTMGGHIEGITGRVNLDYALDTIREILQ